MKMNGKELDGLSFKELQQLEHQLSQGLLSIKDKKEQVILEQLKRSRLQEQKAMSENEILRKQIEELERKSKPNSQELNQGCLVKEIRAFSLTVSKPEYDISSADDYDRDDHSDTCLHLGLSTNYHRKKIKVDKIESVSTPCNN
ncbi:agamous-like MADS-box protein AGL18 [Carica papaya]|uniref:agamous-like MADS-box protein AGL18 n=1 Tax=Carica papaya TaxID=3649 RepID=UPI000B8D08F7|nr:agamous-like MADS-box protein AGL18 [Carica papaya]